MNNLNQFASLDWALSFNPNLKKMIIDAYKNRISYLRYLDDLIKELKSGHCNGIREKVKDADNLEKFRSTVSELEIARLLIRYGKSVQLFPDNYMKGRSPPDMLASDSGLEAFIEVKRLTEDETVSLILEFLRDFLKQPDRHFRVDVILSESLSMPTVKWGERKTKEGLVRKSLGEFEKQFMKTDFSFLPVQIKTDEAIFEVHRSGSEEGYPGIIQTEGIRVPQEKLVEKIKRDILEKALKRKGWEGEHLTKLYIVAIDCEQIWIDEKEVDEALIGRSVYVMEPLPMPAITIPEEVERAKERGWEQFLLDKCIIPHDRVYLHEKNRGIYFTKAEAKQISGALLRFKTERFYFVPNPFAHDEINNPRLMNFLQ